MMHCFKKKGVITILALVLLQLAVVKGHSQSDGNTGSVPGADTAKVNALLQETKAFFSSDPEKAFALSDQAKKMAQSIGFKKGEALALKNTGIVYYFQGKHIEALDFYNQSLQVFLEMKDNSGIANLYSNIGVVYYDRGDDTKALENYLQSLRYSELAGDKFRILIALNNVGGVYFIKPATYDKALEYYLKALQLCEELDKQTELGAISVNIGSIYYERNEVTKALEYFNKALKAYGDSEGSLNAYNAIGKAYNKAGQFEPALKNLNAGLTIAEKFNSKMGMVQARMGLGNVYLNKGDYKTALSQFSKAESTALELQANHELSDLYQVMARTYSKTANYKKAFDYQTLYTSVKDSLYSEESTKKIGTLQFDYDLQKKQGEINLLTKDKALTDQKLKRQQLMKTAATVGLVLVMLIALLIYRNYRAKVRTHRIVDRQKAEIEGLLLNILPQEVATELQVKGKSEPRYFESVSVMFTDFKGFTAIADKMQPQDLVEELSTCFVVFDEIMEKYNLEKIKTIGDAYMCAGGIPTPDENHVENMIKAAIEMRNYALRHNQKRMDAGLVPWEMRIGIHVGPIVAGVVGKRKYAYDIWGSTVNIASRMESNGEPGKINISSSVYELVKDQFACTYRGKIYAKNIGDIDMYFLEGRAGVPKEEIAELGQGAERDLKPVSGNG
jgi:class 3 adenylate cyclase/Tfp pilus assembly protein PilF